MLQEKDKLFVSMPNFKTSKVTKENKPIYQDICNPVTKEFREMLYDEILNCYQQEKEKAAVDKQEGKGEYPITLQQGNNEKSAVR